MTATDATIHGYGPYTHGCRCDTCRAAKATYMRRRRAAAKLAAEADPNRDVTTARVLHGTRHAYEEHGCRCTSCTQAEINAGRLTRPSHHTRSNS